MPAISVFGGYYRKNPPQIVGTVFSCRFSVFICSFVNIHLAIPLQKGGQGLMPLHRSATVLADKYALAINSLNRLGKMDFIFYFLAQTAILVNNIFHFFY